MFDTTHPMLRPLWVRLLICAISGAWAVFEWLLGNQTWAALFGGVSLYCVYLLLLIYKPGEPNSEGQS